MSDAATEFDVSSSLTAFAGEFDHLEVPDDIAQFHH
jgi:hypothetical protein